MLRSFVGPDGETDTAEGRERMSTRGVIARAKADGWEGVYQHSDSYPTYLGRHLWAGLHNGRSPADFVAQDIEAHKGGWSSWPDRCYCHDMDRDGPTMAITDKDVDWLFSEWVYVIDPDSATFSVIRGCVRRDGTHTETAPDGRTWEAENYGCSLVGSFSLDGEEPDWMALECGVGLEYCGHVDGYHARL